MAIALWKGNEQLIHSVQDAQTHFPELIANLQLGESAQIVEGEKIVARLMAERMSEVGAYAKRLTAYASPDGNRVMLHN